MKHNSILKKITIFLCMLMMLGAVCPCYAEDNSLPADDPHVLFIGSYSYEWESTPKHLAGISDTLSDYANIEYVFMDTKHRSYEDVKGEVYQDIAGRAKSEKFDYVIAADDAALQFVEEYRDDLFKDIPVVFEGINDVAYAEKASEDSLTTGIIETFPLEETIRMALKLNPDATKVAAVTDDTLSGKGSTKQYENAQSSFPDISFSEIDCSVLSADDIAKRVSACGDDTILIFLMMTTDADGNLYTQTQAAKFITANAHIPVFKSDELGIGDGILGGVVVSYYDMAADAAKIVLELSRGADIADYKVTTAGSVCEFDENIVKKYKISKSDISNAYDGNVKYVNETISFFQEHQQVLIPGFIIIAGLLIAGLYVVLTDRRKRKLMQELQKKDLMLDSILSNIQGGLAIYRVRNDSSHTIDTVYTSKGIPAITGRTMEEYNQWIAGDLVGHTIAEEDLERVRAVLHKYIPLKKPFYLNAHFNNKNGTKSYVSMSSVWDHTESDGSNIYYVVYMDMTQQEKAGKAEQEALKAKASDAAKSDFLSRMSHDMRTPLNAILGYEQLASGEPDLSLRSQEYLHKIEYSGKYLLDQIDDILDMSMIGNGKLVLHEKTMNFPALLHEIEVEYRRKSSEKGIALSCHFIGVDNPAWIIGDARRIRQIYSNLLMNAIQFSKEGSVIKWTVRNTAIEQGKVHIYSCVSDQGCGISEERIGKLFQPFEPGDPFSSRIGTGLGLSLVKSLIEMMSGTVQIHSEIGKGSDFIAEMDRVTVQDIPLLPIPKNDFTLKGQRILVCEDNGINAEITKKLLQKKGCIAEWAENGRICLSMYQNAKHGYYNAILMDIRMPVMDGLEAAREIRKSSMPDAKTIPIIAMSANTFEQDVAASLASGMNAHLPKPVEPEKLYTVLSELIIQARNIKVNA
jgi:CheY-like chemotaxis protein